MVGLVAIRLYRERGQDDNWQRPCKRAVGLIDIDWNSRVLNVACSSFVFWWQDMELQV